MARPRRQRGSLQIRIQGGQKKYVALYYDAEGKRRFETIGLVSRMKKGTAEARLAELVAPVNARGFDPTVKAFIESVYLPFGRETWKASTAFTTEQRVRTHIVGEFGNKRVSELRRQFLQEWLTSKARTKNPRTERPASHSLIAHLRWDIKHILDLAARDELVRTNQALDLTVPRVLAESSKRTAAPAQLVMAIAALGVRERLVVRLAALVGLRPGEIFGLQWRHVDDNAVTIQQRVYRGIVDTVKNQRPRVVALPGTVTRDLRRWAELSTALKPGDWIFPSETKGLPGNKDSVWRHAIAPVLKPLGLDWLNFQVMRRTWATTAAGVGIDAKVRADQLGHGVDVDINEYTQVEFSRKLAAVTAVQRVLECSRESANGPN